MVPSSDGSIPAPPVVKISSLPPSDNPSDSEDSSSATTPNDKQSSSETGSDSDEFTTTASREPFMEPVNLSEPADPKYVEEVLASTEREALTYNQRKLCNAVFNARQALSFFEEGEVAGMKSEADSIDSELKLIKTAVAEAEQRLDHLRTQCISAESNKADRERAYASRKQMMRKEGKKNRELYNEAKVAKNAARAAKLSAQAALEELYVRCAKAEEVVQKRRQLSYPLELEFATVQAKKYQAYDQLRVLEAELEFALRITAEYGETHCKAILYSFVNYLMYLCQPTSIFLSI